MQISFTKQQIQSTSEYPSRKHVKFLVLFRLLLLTEKEPIKRRARIELKKFHDAYRSYMRAIEENIETIQARFRLIWNFLSSMFQKNPKIEKSALKTLPDYPQLSDDFTRIYEEAVQEKNGIPDTECVICIHSMGPEHKLCKCISCKRSYHTAVSIFSFQSVWERYFQCALGWYRTKNECPACGNQYLNPRNLPTV